MVYWIYRLFRWKEDTVGKRQQCNDWMNQKEDIDERNKNSDVGVIKVRVFNDFFAFIVSPNIKESQ